MNTRGTAQLEKLELKVISEKEKKRNHKTIGREYCDDKRYTQVIQICLCGQGCPPVAIYSYI